MTRRMRPVDLRTDAITRPTPAMLAAAGRVMPTVRTRRGSAARQLESRVAAMVGHEDAVFAPTGSTANLILLMAVRDRGELVVLEAESHLAWTEAASVARVAGLSPMLVEGSGGIVSATMVGDALDDSRLSDHRRTAAVCLETPHNLHGGRVPPPAAMAGVVAAAHSRGVHAHVDGARIVHAMVATGAPLPTLLGGADSATFGFNKGLSCPSGAVLTGRRAVIERARRDLALLGVSNQPMADIAASMCLVALDTMVERLSEDHARARSFAQGMAEVTGFRVDLAGVETNTIMLTVEPPLNAPSVVRSMAAAGLWAWAVDHRRIRAMTHRHVTDLDIEHAIVAVADAVQAGRPRATASIARGSRVQR